MTTGRRLYKICLLNACSIHGLNSDHSFEDVFISMYSGTCETVNASSPDLVTLPSSGPVTLRFRDLVTLRYSGLVTLRFPDQVTLCSPGVVRLRSQGMVRLILSLVSMGKSVSFHRLILL